MKEQILDVANIHNWHFGDSISFPDWYIFGDPQFLKTFKDRILCRTWGFHKCIRYSCWIWYDLIILSKLAMLDSCTKSCGESDVLGSLVICETEFCFSVCQWTHNNQYMFLLDFHNTHMEKTLQVQTLQCLPTLPHGTCWEEIHQLIEKGYFVQRMCMYRCIDVYTLCFLD